MSHTAIRRWLEEHTPIEPSLLDGAGLGMAIADRMEALRAGEPEYIEALSNSADEVDLLIAAIAVPETWLFRYPRSYELLAGHLQKRLAEGSASLRMLSIGCATGQEPYCMAMTALHAGWPADRVHVEGVDRNAEFLRAAGVGRYGAASIRTEIPAWAVSFLDRSGDGIGIDTAVRAMVRFTRADVTESVALRGTGPWDVVFCRNLLIYLNAAARDRLLLAICEQLSPGGLLFVGHAEQVMRGTAPLRAVAAPHAFALERVRDAAPVVAVLPSAARPQRHNTASPRWQMVQQPPSPARVQPPADRRTPTPPGVDSLDDARTLADSGRGGEAETMIRGIIAHTGPTAPAMELLGMIRMSVNDSESARRLFEQAVYLEPARSTSLLQLALISEQAGDARRAQNYWDRARRASAHKSEGER